VYQGLQSSTAVTRSIALLAGSKFAKPFNAIRAVQPAREKYSA
jgi:hypothetical protein